MESITIELIIGSQDNGSTERSVFIVQCMGMDVLGDTFGKDLDKNKYGRKLLKYIARNINSVVLFVLEGFLSCSVHNVLAIRDSTTNDL
jgi:hypothetical protein